MSDPEGKARRMASVLGETGFVLGNVEGTGDLEIRGRVQGDIHLSGRCAVTDQGSVLGRIEALHISIAGTVRGDLLATDGVSIAASATVEGNIEAPRVEIEAGALVRGQLRTGGGREARAQLSTGDDSDAGGSGTVGSGTVSSGAVPSGAVISLPDDELETQRPRRKRRRRKGLSREGDPELKASGEARSVAPPAEAQGTTASAEIRVGPPRPTEPKPRAAASPAVPDSPPARSGKAPVLPTFVKGARGHLRQ